jgi:hypothetical protein
MGRSSDGAGIGLKLGLCVYRRLVEAQNWEAKAELQSLIKESTNTDSKDQKDDVLEERNDKINQFR